MTEPTIEQAVARLLVELGPEAPGSALDALSRLAAAARGARENHDAWGERYRREVASLTAELEQMRVIADARLSQIAEDDAMLQSLTAERDRLREALSGLWNASTEADMLLAHPSMDGMNHGRARETLKAARRAPHRPISPGGNVMEYLRRLAHLFAVPHRECRLCRSPYWLNPSPQEGTTDG